MNITRIQATLQTLFQDDSRWAHPGQRVVFWYDPDQQFQDTFAEIQLDGIEKLQLNDTPFTVKHRLLIEQPAQAFLLYAPFLEPDRSRQLATRHPASRTHFLCRSSRPNLC